MSFLGRQKLQYLFETNGFHTHGNGHFKYVSSQGKLYAVFVPKELHTFLCYFLGCNSMNILHSLKYAVSENLHEMFMHHLLYNSDSTQ